MPSSPILGAPLPSASDARGQAYQHLADAVGVVEKSTVPRFATATDRGAKIPAPVRGQFAWLDTAGGILTVYTGTTWARVAPTLVEADRVGYSQRGYDGSNVYDLATKTFDGENSPYMVQVHVTGEFLITGGGLGAYLQINQTGAAGDTTRARWFVQSNPGSGSAACSATIVMPTGGILTVKASLSVFANTNVQVYTDVHSKLETVRMAYGIGA